MPRTQKIGITKSILYTALALTFFLYAGSTARAGRLIEPRDNPYGYLSVPTQVTRFGDTWYVADMYHGQFIYSKELGTPLKQWKIMANGLAGAHSVAYDGSVFMVVDTENNRVRVYRKVWNGFEETQVFDDVGVRPHYVVYDGETGLFCAWSSMTGEMYLFARNGESAEVSRAGVLSVPELKGRYVRSFFIEGDTVYLPCADTGKMYAVSKTTFKVKKIYAVPQEIAGIVQLTRIQDYYYVSVSSDMQYDQSHATIVRAKSLNALQKGEYEDLSAVFAAQLKNTAQTGGASADTALSDAREGYFGADAAPYYISKIDGMYYTPLIRPDGKSGILKFEVVDNRIERVKEITYP